MEVRRNLEQIELALASQKNAADPLLEALRGYTKLAEEAANNPGLAAANAEAAEPSDFNTLSLFQGFFDRIEKCIANSFRVFGTQIFVFFDGIDPENIVVQLYAEPQNGEKPEIYNMKREGKVSETEKGYFFTARLPIQRNSDKTKPSTRWQSITGKG